MNIIRLIIYGKNYQIGAYTFYHYIIAPETNYDAFKLSFQGKMLALISWKEKVLDKKIE